MPDFYVPEVLCIRLSIEVNGLRVRAKCKVHTDILRNWVKHVNASRPI